MFYFLFVWRHSYVAPNSYHNQSVGEVILFWLDFPALAVTAGLSSLIFEAGSGAGTGEILTRYHLVVYWVEMLIFALTSSFQWLIIGYGISVLRNANKPAA